MIDSKYFTKEQKKSLAEIHESYKDRLHFTKNIITVGDPFEAPSVIIANQGDLGIAFIERSGHVSWLNNIGEHMLLSFLIDKHYHPNVVRNSREQSSFEVIEETSIGDKELRGAVAAAPNF